MPEDLSFYLWLSRMPEATPLSGLFLKAVAADTDWPVDADSWVTIEGHLMTMGAHPDAIMEGERLFNQYCGVTQ